MGHIRTAALVSIFMLTLPSAPFKLDVSPHTSFEPSDITLTVRVEPDPRNRRVVVDADSANYYRATEIQLDGASAPINHILEWKRMPAGEYEAMARLFQGSDHQVASTTARFVIVPRERFGGPR